MMVANIQANIVAVAVLLLILLSDWNSRVYLPENSSFKKLSVSLLLLLALDSVMLILDMQDFPGSRFCYLAVTYAYYVVQAFMCYLWGIYSCKLTHVTLTGVRLLLHRIPCFLALAFLAGNPLTQDVFSISAENYYGRGWGLGGIVYTVCAFYYLVEAMVLTAFRLHDSTRSNRRDYWNLLLSSALPVLGAIIQLFLFGLNIIWSFAALGLLNLHFNVQTRHAVMAERELEKSRTAVMLSQIQPHFLYNALTGIKSLCSSDPLKARDAMEHFSYFLRGNLDSLSDARLISFEKEIEHLSDYFYLEKMRFGDRVNLVLELNEVDFFLPPLTLQPLVENAVRYGISKKAGGGTVTVRSERQEDNILIRISDNGIGFEADAKKEDGRSHTGIDNVRSRLSLQCGGSLQIYSEKGAGTKVLILLPGKEKKDGGYTG